MVELMRIDCFHGGTQCYLGRSLCSMLCVPCVLCYVFPLICARCSLCSALPRILSSPHNSQLSSNLSCSGEHSCNSFSSLSFCHGCHPTPVMLLSRLCCVIFSESCDWHDQYFDCSLNFHRPNNSVGRWYIAFIFLSKPGLQVYPFLWKLHLLIVLHVYCREQHNWTKIEHLKIPQLKLSQNVTLGQKKKNTWRKELWLVHCWT